MSVKITSVKIWRRKASDAALIGKKGVIESYTVIRVAPLGFAKYTPYVVALIKLPTGKKHIGQLTDYNASDVEIGTKVEAVLRRMRTEGKKDVIPYVIKFRPL